MPARIWRNGNIIHCCDALNSEINMSCGQKQKPNKQQWKELQFQPYSRLHVGSSLSFPLPPAGLVFIWRIQAGAPSFIFSPQAGADCFSGNRGFCGAGVGTSPRDSLCTEAKAHGCLMPTNTPRLLDSSCREFWDSREALCTYRNPRKY